MNSSFNGGIKLFVTDPQEPVFVSTGGKNVAPGFVANFVVKYVSVLLIKQIENEQYLQYLFMSFNKGEF